MPIPNGQSHKVATDLETLETQSTDLVHVTTSLNAYIDDLRKTDFAATQWGGIALDGLRAAANNLLPVWSQRRHDQLIKVVPILAGHEWLDATTYILRRYGRKPKPGEARALTRLCQACVRKHYDRNYHGQVEEVRDDPRRPRRFVHVYSGDGVVELLKGKRIIRYFKRLLIDHVVKVEPKAQYEPLRAPSNILLFEPTAKRKQHSGKHPRRGGQGA